MTIGFIGMRSRLGSVLRDPVLPWVFAFVLTALIVPQRGGANTNARLATMRAITEQGTIRIDDYKDWSVDWALAPDGHIYSNKAPGSALLGLPFFAIFDVPFLHASPPDAQGRHPMPGNLTYLVLLFCVQLLPFSIVVMLLARELRSRGVSELALQFFALAAFFGCTTAIYFGCYSGHGLAAWLFLAGFSNWRQQRGYATGFFIAAAALTDYATIMTLPFVLAATVWRTPSLRPFSRQLATVLIGALPIAVLWIWYHQTAFGSPFALAAGFANPENLTIDPETTRGGVRGIVAIFPYPRHVISLLFGAERGLIVTQAWILVLAILAFARKNWRRESLFIFGGLIGLIWLNASVGSWAAGRSAGPRYLCLIFPSIAYLAALTWQELPRVGRWFLWLGLAEAIVFRILIFPFGERAPVENLWAFYIHRYLEAGASPVVIWRLTVILGCLAIAGGWVVQSLRQINRKLA